VYGPVRTVVWQGSAGDRRPYADLTGNPSIEIRWDLNFRVADQDEAAGAADASRVQVSYGGGILNN